MPKTLTCSACGEPVRAQPPKSWPSAWGSRPRYSHRDGMPLCLIPTSDGFQLAQPVEAD